MNELESFLKEIQQLKSENNELKLFEYMCKHIEIFFSTSDILNVYQNIKSINVNLTSLSLPKLIKAWLAFLCGDNATVSLIMRDLDEIDFKEAHEYSMYCSLKAISGWNLSIEERIEFASLSVDVLQKDDKSFYMANALLTYGQMLSSQDKYRHAAESFSNAYDLFDINKMQFPAIISRVNELLNRCKLGEYKNVIDICQNILIMSAQFNTESLNNWDIIHLPLGICYYELNKSYLATKHLLIAKDSIERLKLFHMHGLIEIYLFKSYFSLDDSLGMDLVYKNTKTIFEPMNDRMGGIILSMFYLFMNTNINDSNVYLNIQLIEVFYETSREKSPSLVFQTLVYLKSQGLSSLISVQEINKHLEKLRYIGFVSDLQLFLIHCANLHQYEGYDTLAIDRVKEAIDLYKVFGICAAFNFASIKILNHVKKLDESLWKNFTKEISSENNKIYNQLLSNREKEIMQLLALGKTNKEVSDILFIEVGTVKWHINHIFSKLQVNNRVQAIEKAKVLGEISNIVLI